MAYPPPSLAELALRVVCRSNLPVGDLPDVLKARTGRCFYINADISTQVLAHRHIDNAFPAPYYYALARRIIDEMETDCVRFNPFPDKPELWRKACVLNCFPLIFNFTLVDVFEYNSTSCPKTWSALLLCMHVIAGLAPRLRGYHFCN